MGQRTIENSQNISLEDLGFISDICRDKNFATMHGKKFVAAYKPIVIEAWESGQFKEREEAISIASKLAIATAAVHKYSNDEPELWGCIVEMLKWSL